MGAKGALSPPDLFFASFSRFFGTFYQLKKIDFSLSFRFNKKNTQPLNGSKKSPPVIFEQSLPLRNFKTFFYIFHCEA